VAGEPARDLLPARLLRERVMAVWCGAAPLYARQKKQAPSGACPKHREEKSFRYW